MAKAMTIDELEKLHRREGRARAARNAEEHRLRVLASVQPPTPGKFRSSKLPQPTSAIPKAISYPKLSVRSKLPDDCSPEANKAYAAEVKARCAEKRAILESNPPLGDG